MTKYNMPTLFLFRPNYERKVNKLVIIVQKFTYEYLFSLELSFIGEREREKKMSACFCTMY